MTLLPSTMRAVLLRAYDGKPESLTVAEVPVPRPGPGEVLVRVSASPINPSDLMFLRGLYGFKKALPTVPGFEGSGTVVEAGAGLMSSFLKGRRVACAAADAKIAGGIWAEYVVTSAQFCMPLRKYVELEQGATLLVNPLTAWALMDEARRGGHKAVVQTAAASALGKMVIRLGKKFGIPVINVVRRAEQVEVLRTMNADHVLNSSAADFDSALSRLCHKLGASIGFDAVSGDMSARVLSAQPKNARLIVYGSLSLGPVQGDPASLIFEGKRVEGFWLSGWLRNQTLIRQLRVAYQVQGLLAGELKTEVRARFPLEKAARALEMYLADMTAGKVLLTSQE